MEKKLSKKLEQFKPSGIRTIMERASQLEREGHTVYRFELGRPDFDTPKYIKEAAKKSLDDGNVFYTSNMGDRKLREAIAHKLKTKNGMDYDIEEIIITVGLSEGILDLLTAILEEGDEILVPGPTFISYNSVPGLLGAKPIAYALEEEKDFQPDLEEMRSKITDRTKAVVLVTPNNPTGSVLHRESLEEIAQLAIEKDLLIISDEVYEDIIYDGEKHISIASLPNMRERTVTLNGFSKAYSMTGWRLGYVVGPKEIIEGVNKIHQVNTTCASSFVQEAAITALEKESGEVQEMVDEYQRRRDFLIERINKIDGLSAIKPKGAFYLFINIKELGIPSQEFAEYLLEEAKVAMVGGTVFGDDGEGYIRMSYASSYENIVKACDLMEEAIKNLKNKK